MSGIPDRTGAKVARTQVWSCGGGVQSAAIAALIAQGRLPRPDIAAIVDTEREKSSTWEYLDSVIRPALAPLQIHRIAKSRFATVDLYRNNDILLPAYTANGKLPTFCSNEWKRRVLMRWLRSVMEVKQCRVWMGISADEMQRVRVDDKPAWFQSWYPLCFEIQMRRAECVALVESMGWPKPPRSSCWMCPNMGNEEWRGLSEDDLARASLLEATIQARDPELWLHKSRRPIGERPFDEETGDKSECQTGFCFV